jgi:hypothetical protein
LYRINYLAGSCILLPELCLQTYSDLIKQCQLFFILYFYFKFYLILKNKIELTQEDFYFNEQGYRVFTEKYHLKRGHCCKSGCKHCPFGYDKNTDSFN